MVAWCEWEWGKSLLVGLELGLWMECKDWLKFIDSGGGYLAEDAEVGDVMYIFGLSPVLELGSEKTSFGNGGTRRMQGLAEKPKRNEIGNRLLEPGKPFCTTSHSLLTRPTSFSDFLRSMFRCSHSRLFSSRMAPNCAAT